MRMFFGIFARAVCIQKCDVHRLGTAAVLRDGPMPEWSNGTHLSLWIKDERYALCFRTPGFNPQWAHFLTTNPVTSVSRMCPTGG